MVEATNHHFLCPLPLCFDRRKKREAMSVPSSSGDFPAVSTAKFGGGGLPRSYQHNEAKFSKVKIDPPEPVAGPFLSWARDAQLTMSSLRFDRRRSQGRIDGSIWRLRDDEEDEEEEEERGNQKKRPKMRTADSRESDGVDGSEEEEETEKALDSDESEYSSESEEEESEVDETEDTTDSDEPEDGEEEEGGEHEIKGKPPVGCRRSKRLRKVAACSEEE